MICECGNGTFVAHQVMTADVIVDENGVFLDNCECGLEAATYDSEDPFGPFTCTKCGKEYDELSE